MSKSKSPSTAARKASHTDTLRLATAAMLTAMSIVIGIICKNFLDFGSGIRITFENLPIILAGIFFGPWVGGAVGIVADLISYLLSSQAYPPNLIVTFGAFSVGAVSGLVAKYVIRPHCIKQIVVSGAAAHLVGSMIIKSIGLYQFFQWGVLFRIPLYLVLASVEICLLCMLWKQASFRRLLEKL